MLTFCRRARLFITNLLEMRVLDPFIPRARAIEARTLLLVRLDSIGDFVLFRNFIATIRHSAKYAGYRITLLGNSQWRELAVALDARYVDAFIWLDRSLFETDRGYRRAFLAALYGVGYEVIVSPVYSRDSPVTDRLVMGVRAQQKIGSRGNLTNIRRWDRWLNDRRYTRLVAATPGTLFEFQRNREFVAALLECTVDIAAPSIDPAVVTDQPVCPPRTLIIFVGASSSARQWPVANFAQVAALLAQRQGLQVRLCGGPSDVAAAAEFARQYPGSFVDSVGRTSLVQLLALLRSASLIISNETSAPHLAMALRGAPVLVLSNGNHFGRFTPYPADMADRYDVLFHPSVDPAPQAHAQNCARFAHGSTLDMAAISVERVLRAAELLLLRSPAAAP